MKVKHLIQINDQLYMGMELIKHGSLSRFVDKRARSNTALTDLEASQIIRGIIDAVAYIHERGIIHRDLKLANVLIDDIEDLRSIKIIDFGFGNC